MSHPVIPSEIIYLFTYLLDLLLLPRWGTADAEIKDPLVGVLGVQRFPLSMRGVGV